MVHFLSRKYLEVEIKMFPVLRAIRIYFLSLLTDVIKNKISCKEKKYLIAFHEWKRDEIERACAEKDFFGMGEEYWVREDLENIIRTNNAIVKRVWRQLYWNVFEGEAAGIKEYTCFYCCLSFLMMNLLKKAGTLEGGFSGYFCKNLCSYSKRHGVCRNKEGNSWHKLLVIPVNWLEVFSNKRYQEAIHKIMKGEEG